MPVEGRVLFGAAVLAKTIWRRAFGAELFWRCAVVALGCFGAGMFWRQPVQANLCIESGTLKGWSK